MGLFGPSSELIYGTDFLAYLFLCFVQSANKMCLKSVSLDAYFRDFVRSSVWNTSGLILTCI